VSHWIIFCRKAHVEIPGFRRASWNAIIALRAISQWPDGVATLADMDVSDELQQLVQIRTDHCDLHELLDNIAQYKAGKTESTHAGIDS
jgi:hypothetical protein